jgi:chorismate mutase
VREVARIKQAHGIPVIQGARAAAVIARNADRAAAAGLDAAMVRVIWSAIIAAAHRHEGSIVGADPDVDEGRAHHG